MDLVLLFDLNIKISDPRQISGCALDRHNTVQLLQVKQLESGFVLAFFFISR